MFWKTPLTRHDAARRCCCDWRRGAVACKYVFVSVYESARARARQAKQADGRASWQTHDDMKAAAVVRRSPPQFAKNRQTNVQLCSARRSRNRILEKWCVSSSATLIFRTDFFFFQEELCFPMNCSIRYATVGDNRSNRLLWEELCRKISI